MTPAVFLKLLAIFVVIAIGWTAGRAKFFGGGEAARALSNTAFYLFAPALLFRTTARIDFGTMPWSALAAFFVPAVGWMLAIYAWRKWRQRRGSGMVAAEPSVRAISSTFGNTAQLGIPLAAALFGEHGLSIHLAIVSVHALTLLSVLTLLVELDVARSGAAPASLWRTLFNTARNTVIHPIVLPVMVGIAWNLLDVPIPAAMDEILVMLGQAVVPVCLIAIGMSLAHYGIRGSAQAAVWISAAKLLAMPAWVLLAGYFVFGLRGLPLTVIVTAAALPTGANALMFSQRYAAQEAETTAVLVISTVVFVATAPLWLSLLHLIPGG
ncbi:AEC family transporter [Schlegelella sp. S2-27]|uniref:AEC family transporter n=1 Tax=Caldimonas mangrovi TaxID=2944811 RepID=A0ABT0YKM2_9BURK|nr:AEC family transporter [Caldimonas mangrovi]MCM5679286.1 AEC family transporter [Caldimonas mangrovi]